MLRTAVILLLLQALLTAPVRGEPPISISGDMNYPPSSWQHGQQLLGVGPEVIRTALQELGLEVTRSARVPWQRALALTRHGDVDFITSIYKTETRQKALTYIPTPYMADTIVLWVRRDAPISFQHLEDLRDYQGVMIIGYSAGPVFDQYAKQHLRIQRVSRIEQCLRMLVNKRADYLVFSAEVGEVLARLLGYRDALDRLPRPIAIEPLYVAVSNQSPHRELVDAIDRKIQAFSQDGRLQHWIRHYADLYLQQQGATLKSPLP